MTKKLFLEQPRRGKTREAQLTPHKFNNSNKNKQEQPKQQYINILHAEFCFLVFVYMTFF